MKTNLLLLALLFTFFGFAQYTLIPDSNFENALSAYDDIPNDGQVPTANINTVTYLSVVGQNINDLTGIEGFVALTLLNCDNNQLTNLDISQNISLNYLLGNNNQLSSLDVSQNINLINLLVNSNQIVNMDVSQNLNLTFLACSDNQLTSLDVSINNLLSVLTCSNNQLTYLNVKNGNNTNFNNNNFLAFANPNLICIEVDDAVWSTANWTNIDSTSSFSTNCHYNETYVPDDNFENYLETHNASGGTVVVGDPTSMGNGIANDDYVTTANITTVINLDVNSQSIADLTGIEDFLGLIELKCQSNLITNLNLSQNTSLSRLTCNSNQLTSLNVFQNTALTVLLCNNNQLTNLDVTQNLLLNRLWCHANQLTNLDVTQNVVLERLLCNNNQLTSLDITQNITLKNLTCNNNQLSSLNITYNILMIDLQCSNNQLINLNVKNGSNTNINIFASNNNPNLICIEVDNVAYSTANWTNIDPWSSFNTNCNQAMVPDDNFETYLETHDANGNIVSLGDPTSMGNGIALDDYVTIANVSNVATLNIPNLNIQNIIGIEYFTSLTNLNCHTNSISNVDVSQNTALTVLSFAFNQLTNIDVSSNINLFHLNVRDNNLSGIDISQNTALTFFNCGQNQIPNINVTQNNLLTFLGIDNNLFTNIDVSQNLDLVTFTCDFNQVTNLDLSSHSNLEQFSAIFNELTYLNIKNGNNINFSIYWSSDNPNLTCIIVDDATWSNANWSAFKDVTSTFVNNQVDCDTLGANDNLLSNLSIYPNPTKNKITIKIDRPSNYKIFNIGGQLIKKGNLLIGENSLDVFNFSNGVYFIKINSNSNNAILKIIKN